MFRSSSFYMRIGKLLHMFIPSHTLSLFCRVKSILGDIHPVFLEPISLMAKTSDRGRINWLKHDDRVEESGLFRPGKQRCQVAHNSLAIITCEAIITKPESVSSHWFMTGVPVDLRELFLHQDCQAVQQIAYSTCETSGFEGFQDMTFKVLRNFV